MNRKISPALFGLVLICFFVNIGCNSNNLSKSKAEKALEANFNSISAIFISEDNKKDLFKQTFWGFGLSGGDLQKLEENGLIKEVKPCSRCLGSIKYQFTEKAKPYLKSEQDKNRLVNSLAIAVLTDVRVSSVSKPADLKGYKVCRAIFTVNYKLTPIGEMVSLKPDLSKNGEATFVLFEDGWKLDKSMTTVNGDL